MKSIKPGRGPSMMSGIGSIFAGVFGIIWTIAAVSMGAGFIALFGVVFIVMAIVMAVYNMKNATGKNRYSSFDITDEGEETDPLNEHFGEQKEEITAFSSPDHDAAFCPYCGTAVQGDFAFCQKCGRKLP